MQSGGVLARGVTIAIRYCAIRRQFQDRDAKEWEKGENQVLNYKMVQIRLLTLLAATYALHFTGKGMMDLYQQNQKRMQSASNDSNARGAGPEEINSGSDLLADLHATSCGLKSLASSTAAEGLEVCRRACGGHGYSSFSGIGSWYADYLPTTTWEGDNYMLTQQVARYVSPPPSPQPTFPSNQPPSYSNPRAPSSKATAPPTTRPKSSPPTTQRKTSAPPSTSAAATATWSPPSRGARHISPLKPYAIATKRRNPGTRSWSTSTGSRARTRSTSSSRPSTTRSTLRPRNPGSATSRAVSCTNCSGCTRCIPSRPSLPSFIAVLRRRCARSSWRARTRSCVCWRRLGRMRSGSWMRGISRIGSWIAVSDDMMARCMKICSTARVS